MYVTQILINKSSGGNPHCDHMVDLAAGTRSEVRKSTVPPNNLLFPCQLIYNITCGR